MPNLGEVGLGESKVFWGLARPPTSYGAYSGGDEKNAKWVTLCPFIPLPVLNGMSTATWEHVAIPMFPATCHRTSNLLYQSTVSTLNWSCCCTCRYAFDYPASWKVETVGKVYLLPSSCQRRFQKKTLSLQMADCSISDVLGPMQNEKGMQGIDCRVRNKIKGELCIPKLVKGTLGP